MELLPGPLAADDPLLAPIAGIDLARYAQLSKAVSHYGLRTQAEVDAYVERAGHTPAAWQEASAGWTSRFRASTALSVLYVEQVGAVVV
jgi:hypothetical protein